MYERSFFKLRLFSLQSATTKKVVPPLPGPGSNPVVLLHHLPSLQKDGYVTLNVSLPLRALLLHPAPLARDGDSGGTRPAALLGDGPQPPTAPGSSGAAAMNSQLCSASPLRTGLLKSKHMK